MVNYKSTIIKKNKSNYILIGYISLFLLIIGATFAYFTAGVTDDNTISGNTATVSFGLFVEKVTTADMAFGLIPMYDDRAPFAADNKCKDEIDNGVCQIYKITVRADSNTVMFLDGYITVDTKEGVDVAFTRVYPVTEGDDENNIVKFSTPSDFDVNKDVKNGVRVTTDDNMLNRNDDSSCLFVTDDKIGGDDDNDIRRIYYVMMWLHDTGVSQDDIQGMEKAYTGKVIFTTSQGNEISATFD